MIPQIIGPKPEFALFCQQHGISWIAVLGSALWDDFGPEREIDLLVELKPGRMPRLLDVAGLKIELSQLFAGRNIDLRTAEYQDHCFRQDWLDRAEVQYARSPFSPRRR